MIKILYLCESLNRGGAEQLLLTTLKYLDPSGFSAVVCCIGKKGEIGREIEDLGFKVIELNRKLHICNLAAIFHLAKVLREEKPDILHTHLYFANIFGRVAAKLAGVRRVITTLHNPDYSYEDNGRWTYKVRKAMDKYSGKLCNSAFIAVSGYVKNDFQRQLGFENIKVLHNYLEIDRFKTPQLSEIRRKRDELGVSPDEVLLLNIGRLHPQKGQAQLIDAFAMLCRDHPKAKLAIVGKGVLKNELKDKARALGISSRVMFLENRKDIPEIIHASDIFVFPSLYEGFGIAMAEAMASAKPVIASNIEALKEMARDGVDAILVENNNCAKLSEEISGLIRDRARQIDLGESARNRAASLFEAAR